MSQFTIILWSSLTSPHTMSKETRTLLTQHLTRGMLWCTVQAWIDLFPGGMLGCKVSSMWMFRLQPYLHWRSSSSCGSDGSHSLIHISSQLKRGHIQGCHLSPISQMKMIPLDSLTQSMLSGAVIWFLPLSFFLPPLQGIRLAIGKCLVSIGGSGLFFFFKFANGSTSALQTMTPTCSLLALVWEI